VIFANQKFRLKRSGADIAVLRYHYIDLKMHTFLSLMVCPQLSKKSAEDDKGFSVEREETQESDKGFTGIFV
jgi:hypothetical protein